MYEKQFCRPRKKLKRKKATRSNSSATIPQAISVVVPENQLSCSFVFSDQFKETMLRYFVIFKFRSGCVTPRNVDGKLAWTRVNSDARRSSQDIQLMYKTHNGGHLRDEYIPLSSIEPLPPTSHPEDLALVIRGEHSGKVVFPRQFAKNADKQRVGTYCTLTKLERKKNAILFPLDSIIRIRDIKHGPFVS